MTKWHMTRHVSDRLTSPPLFLWKLWMLLTYSCHVWEMNKRTTVGHGEIGDLASEICVLCKCKQREEARNLCIISNSICIIISLGNCRSQHPRYSRLYVTCILRHQIFVLGILWDPLSGLTPQDFLWKVVVIKGGYALVGHLYISTMIRVFFS